ncbi:hypothetical protein SAMN05421763_11526 [[Luteovulum] sphaeroides subsp. megalophilum]|uniref:hypothetical protein n=1 Tax=Cereibacter sphaeroides TaxID=1063 RepID=UPI000B65BA63|nr:hypothetical protein [Cereibacter sphaeroides]SNT40874.1 hypothetical protein SAMN05421763_11526 [[Luteovulum] sphaeroides subsp. megalophilum]
MRFLSYDKVARLPVPELMKRVDAYVEKVKPGKTDRIEAAAVLGMVEPPKITVTRALELFWQIAEKDRTRGKDEDQIWRWKNPRKKAVANFVKVIGDKPIEEISSDDLLDWRAWWEEKIELEDLTPNSANKDFTHFSDTLKTVIKAKRLGLVIPMGGIHLAAPCRGGGGGLVGRPCACVGQPVADAIGVIRHRLLPLPARRFRLHQPDIAIVALHDGLARGEGLPRIGCRHIFQHPPAREDHFDREGRLLTLHRAYSSNTGISAQATSSSPVLSSGS